MKLNFFLLFLTPILLTLINANSAISKNDTSLLLEKVQQKVNNFDPSSYKLLKTYFEKEMFYSGPHRKLNKTSLSKALYLYGRIVFFGLKQQGENSLKLAYFFFKLAAEFGSSDALFMIALYSSYKLDGSFNVFTRFDDPESLETVDFLTQNQKLKIYQYVNDRKFSQTLVNLYFSSLQGNQEATLSMGYRQWRGIGVDVNCSAASLYYDKIASELLMKPNKNPKIVQKKRLDHDIYNIKQGIFEILFDQDQVEILENINDLDKKNLPDVLNLAYYYYYGLGGLQMDLKKSFYLFKKINSEQENHHIQSMLGNMYMEGLGTEKDYQQALHLFQKASLVNNSDALNGLGYLYMNGLGVQKNIEKALSYFLKSAQLGNSDGQYNYGILHLMPSSPEITRNKKVGHYYISLAAQQGHSLAQYSLALLHLDGVDFYYSCELAVSLMKSASQLGPWADYLKNGNHFFRKSKFRLSFLNYLIAAFLGDEVGLLNSAIIADKYEIISEQDTNYAEIEDSLLKDPVFQIMKKHTLYRASSPLAFLYGDFLQLLKSPTYLKPKSQNQGNNPSIEESIGQPPHKNSKSAGSSDQPQSQQQQEDLDVDDEDDIQSSSGNSEQQEERRRSKSQQQQQTQQQKNKNSKLQQQQQRHHSQQQYQKSAEQELHNQLDMLKQLLEKPPLSHRNVNKYVAFKSYSLGINDNAFSSMRLGDFYYYGIYDKQSFTEAYKYYKLASSFDANNSIVAQSLFNLGFMNAEGIGTKPNRTQSLIYYNQSFNLNPQTKNYAPFILQFVKFGFLVNLLEPSDVFHNVAGIIIQQYNTGALHDALHGFVLTLLVLTVLTLIGYRMRIINYNEIYGQDINNDNAM